MTLRISLAQINLLVGDIAGNAELVIETSLRARDEQRADAVVFPELTLTMESLFRVTIPPSLTRDPLV